MPKRTNIQLSRADRSKLKAVVANRNSPQKHVWRAKIVLLTADGRGTAEIMCDADLEVVEDGIDLSAVPVVNQFRT